MAQTSLEHDLDVVIVSFESLDFLTRCLDVWAETDARPLVVDNASTDGSADAARSLGAEVISLEQNIGFGAGANVGIQHGSRPYVLVSNADAWPKGPDDVAALLAGVVADDRVGAAGPAFVGIDDEPQPTMLNVASRWWTGSGAVTSFPGTSARPARQARAGKRPTYLIGAAILFRRQALDDVGTFDEAFFLFNEEVDLCLRLSGGGWALRVAEEATFVHVGGVSTRPRWNDAYREQLRGHLRVLDKHEGRAAAEHARRWLAAVLGARALVASTEQRRFLRDSARWLGSSSVPQLLDESRAANPL